MAGFSTANYEHVALASTAKIRVPCQHRKPLHLGMIMYGHVEDRSEKDSICICRKRQPVHPQLTQWSSQFMTRFSISSTALGLNRTRPTQAQSCQPSLSNLMPKLTCKPYVHGPDKLYGDPIQGS